MATDKYPHGQYRITSRIVYVDGKKAGEARNDGRGGETIVHLHLLMHDEQKAVNAWVKSQSPKVYPASSGMESFNIPMSLAVIADDQLEANLEEKKKLCKKDLTQLRANKGIGKVKFRAKKVVILKHDDPAAFVEIEQIAIKKGMFLAKDFGPFED